MDRRAWGDQPLSPVPPRPDLGIDERAGRDGLPSRCTLLFDPGDKALLRFFQAGRYPNGDDLVNVHHALKRFDVEHPPSLAELEAISPIRKARLKSILSLFKNENVVRERDDRLRQSQVLEYAEARVCRWDRIVSDFGQTDRDWSTCGHCDTCDSTAL